MMQNESGIDYTNNTINDNKNNDNDNDKDELASIDGDDDPEVNETSTGLSSG